MNKTELRKTVFVLLSLTVFGFFNDGIYQMEAIKADGETVYLAFAPADPRSLMQGDYMNLRYAIERQAHVSQDEPKRGDIVISTNDRKIGRFVRFHGSEPLHPGEKLLHYRQDFNIIKIVPDSFMFQEGQGKFFQNAVYGEFKFDKQGRHILVGLADESLKPMVPPADLEDKP